MDLHKKYQLRRVINACGKMTHLGGAIVLPETASAAAEAMQHFFVLDELQAAAGRIIAEASGAESGCVTACTAAGITLGVAATMTGTDVAKVYQLPDTEGMANRVLIQKGHCVNYGQPITQAIRLAGARPVEVGVVNRCTRAELRHELERGHVTAIVHVESHHTVRHGWVELSLVAELAHEYDVPVIVDGAAQDLRLRQLIGAGADIVITSAHKFLCSTTGGVVAGRKDLIDAVYLQNRGIGRPMKAGKEEIMGLIAAVDLFLSRTDEEDRAVWLRRMEYVVDALLGLPGVKAYVLGEGQQASPDFAPRAYVDLDDPKRARDVIQAMRNGDPSVVIRPSGKGVVIDPMTLMPGEEEIVARRLKEVLSP